MTSEADGDVMGMGVCVSTVVLPASPSAHLCAQGHHEATPPPGFTPVLSPAQITSACQRRVPVAKSARKGLLTAVQRQTCNRMAGDSMPCKLRRLHGRLPEPSSRQLACLPEQTPSAIPAPPSAFAIESMCFELVAAPRCDSILQLTLVRGSFLEAADARPEGPISVTHIWTADVPTVLAWGSMFLW